MNEPRFTRQHLLLVLLPATLLLGGCLHQGFGGESSNEPLAPAGVYRSTDRGDTWQTVNRVLSVDPTSRPTLDGVSAQTLIMDPTDRQTLYLGSRGQGLYTTYDAARSWWPAPAIRSGTIYDIAVPDAEGQRCSVYLAVSNRVLKSTDCGRLWRQPYFDSRPDTRVQSVAVHRGQSTIVLAGTSSGEILRSIDAGESWETVARVGEDVLSFASASVAPDLIYAVVEKKGLWRSTDSGITWSDMSEGLSEFRGANVISAIAVDDERPDTVVAASSFGLVRTTDGGETWASLPLLTPTGRVEIFDVAMNPQNSAELYYTTATTLYRSVDAGATWETRPLPAANTRTTLLVDPKVPSLLYLGIRRPEETRRGSGLFGL